LSGSDVCWHSSFQRAIRSQLTRRQTTRRVDTDPMASREISCLGLGRHCCHYNGWVVCGYGGYWSTFCGCQAEIVHVCGASSKLHFSAIAVENLGSFDLSSLQFLNDLGNKIRLLSGETVKLNKQHSCSSASRSWSNDLKLQCYCMTLLPRTVRTNRRSSFAFSFLGRPER